MKSSKAQMMAKFHKIPVLESPLKVLEMGCIEPVHLIKKSAENQKKIK
jgi:hypothetical protein